MKSVQLLTCLLLLFNTAGCSNRQGELPITGQSGSPPRIVAPSGAIAKECPNRDSVSDSIIELRSIIDDALLILHDAYKCGAKSPTVELQAQLNSLRQRKIKWDEKNNSLIAGCGLLSGADGTAVYPELPPALDDLSQAGKWLDKSIDDLAICRLQMADAYIQGTQYAATHASKLLEQKTKFDPRRTVLKIPYYIKNADRLNSL